MRSSETLPDFPLESSGRITADFLAFGLADFREAADHVHRLPYGRNTDRADYSLVLREGLGTCSTKHALLAQLAEEHGRRDILLTLGIYEMNEDNTPGIGSMLSRRGLSGIPEAHCYLTHTGVRVDLTHSGGPAAGPIESFLHEENISPASIGTYKTTRHERFLEDWSQDSGASAYGWRDLLSIREECIAALSK